MKVKVIDDIMGSGKTQYAIQLMNGSDNNVRFIYVTPFLDEVQRIKENCITRKFREPYNLGNGKLHYLKEMLAKGVNIATTHSLFSRFDKETSELIRTGNYVLILDEVMDVITQIDITQSDIDILTDGKLVSEDEFDELHWVDGEYSGVFDYIYNMIVNNRVLRIGNKFLYWRFPADIFTDFKEVYVMTYLFDSQIQKYYYDLYDIEYEKYIVSKKGDAYFIEKKPTSENKKKQKLKSLINIHDDKLNEIGENKHSLSFSQYEKLRNTKEFTSHIKKHIYNYFRTWVDGKSKENMWTCFKDDQSILSGKGYTKGFVVHNSRATNMYRDRKNLAYMVNRFMNPNMVNYFAKKDIHIDQDQFALAELLQWIWRSRIREGKPINLYIPSKRMRNILKEWLDG